MKIEVGDRVRFIPENMPNMSYHSPSDGEDHPWSVYFGGLIGCVTAIDTTNREVCVRGRDRDDHSYTIWLSPDALTITEMGVGR